MMNAKSDEITVIITELFHHQFHSLSASLSANYLIGNKYRTARLSTFVIIMNS